MNLSWEAVKMFFIKGGAWMGIQAGAFLFSLLVFFISFLLILFGCDLIFGKEVVINFWENPDGLLVIAGEIGLLILSLQLCVKIWDQTSAKAWTTFKNFIHTGQEV